MPRPSATTDRPPAVVASSVACFPTRNIMAEPNVRLSTGRRRRFDASGHKLSPQEAAAVFVGYSRNHPRAARALAKTLGLPLTDPDAMAGIVPVIRFAYG